MRKMNVLDSKIYALSMTITLMLLVQFLWLGFTVLGAVIFGYYPATIAAFKSIRHFKAGERPFKYLPKYFWTQYKQHFKVGNMIGVSNIVLVYVMITNIRITTAIDTNVSFVFALLLLTIGVVFCLIQPYMLTVISVSKDTLKKSIACAILLAISSPISTFVFAIVLAGYSIGFSYVPSIYMVMGVTLPLLLLSIWAEPKIELLIDDQKELPQWTENAGV